MLIDGEINPVLKRLKSKINDDTVIVLLESKFKQSQIDHLNGLLSYSDFKVEKQRIIDGVLTLIKKW